MTQFKEAPMEAERVLGVFWSDGRPQNFIGGEWADAPQRVDAVDPSTGTVFATTPESSAGDVESAVASAQAAQPEWRDLTMSERAGYLTAFREELGRVGEDLAVLEAIDSGNPMPATRRDLGLALRYLAEWPGQALGFTGRFSKPHADGRSLVSFEPYGVVGKIIAYNHPMLFAVAGMIYPLMAGNTMVVKTSTQTPVATLALGAIVQKTLPPGVVNVLSGGAEAGDALVTHREVKRISFTGSEKTALAIQRRLPSSGIVKHFSAELGGKNPFIIFEDADLPEAAEAAFAGLSLLVSAGQSCQSTAKILVQESVYDQVVEYLARRMSGLRLGRAYDETTEMGPVVSEQHAGRVIELIRSGVEEGARVVVGGTRLDREGYFVEPTLLTDVDPGMRVMREEIFGPVALVVPFRDAEEAVRNANDTPYGLSAAVWTRDIDRAFTVTSQLHAGYIWVNDANRHYPGTPFGGMRGSGVGREESIEELSSYVEPKTVNIKVGRA